MAEKDEKNVKEMEDALPVPWQRIQGAIWLLGLAIIALRDWWWPGILVLVALSGLTRQKLRTPTYLPAPLRNTLETIKAGCGRRAGNQPPKTLLHAQPPNLGPATYLLLRGIFLKFFVKVAVARYDVGAIWQP